MVQFQSLKENDEGVCVREIGSEVMPGVYKLNEFYHGKDYFDSQRGIFMHSIGMCMHTGVTFAAADFDLSEHEYKILWRRQCAL